MDIYFFQWISELGGADTRLKDLIKLFSNNTNFNLHSIPNDSFRLKEKHNVDFLKSHNVKILSWDELPYKLNGFAISFCNFKLFLDRWRLERIKQSGLKFIWSNDMTWRLEEEVSAIQNGCVDALLYIDEYHRDNLLKEKYDSHKSFFIENYFDIESYPLINRSNDIFSVGKHSRPDYLKFSDDFPQVYDLGLNSVKYKIMGVHKNFKERFSWFKFDDKWDLMEANTQPTLEFLKSLDLYMYNSHHSFTETQCRATIESMLTGLPVIAPKKHNFLKQIIHNQTGFLFNSAEESKQYAKELARNNSLRYRMGKEARELNKSLWCNEQKHLEKWQKIFNAI